MATRFSSIIGRSLGLTALLLTGWAEFALGGIPPEVPSKRTSQVFSPFYFQLLNEGENLFTNSGAGPVCQGYVNSLNLRQTGFPGSGLGSATNLVDAIQVLRNPAGILFSGSHSGTLPSLGLDLYAVEAFDSPESASGKLLLYEAIGDVDNSDPDNLEAIVTGVEIGGSPNVRAIAVTRKFLTRHLTEIHSIAQLMGCHSTVVSPSFVSNSHKTRNFIGIGETCLLGTLQSSLGLDLSATVWNNMSGVANDGAGYGNVPIGQAVQLAKTKESFSFLDHVQDSLSPSASNMRLYSAPRLVFAKVQQDVAGDSSFSEQLYSYQFGAGYPYNPGTDYPGPLGTPSVAKTGPLKITLRFSEPMDSGWTEFKVELRFPNGSKQPVTGQWSNFALPAGAGLVDTWTGSTTLPADTGDGDVEVAVRARKVQCAPPGFSTAQDTHLHELDINGSGTSTPGTFDTSVSFAIASPDSSTRTA